MTAETNGTTEPAAAAGASRGSLLAAFAWMGAALVSFILVAISARGAGRTLPTFDMMVYRSAISLAILVAAFGVTGFALSNLRTKRLGLHTLRTFVHFFAQAAWLYALMLIPLATLHAIEFTAPLWIALLAPFMLGERQTGLRILSAVIGFAGALVVMRPGAASIDLGTALALACALGFAISLILTKSLTRTESTPTIMFYMLSLQTVIALALTAGTPKLPDAAAWGWLLVLGITGLTAHFSLVKAFSLADAIVVAPMDFLRLPLIALVGVALYQEPLEATVLLGGAIVVAGNLLNLWGERRAELGRRTRAPAA